MHNKRYVTFLLLAQFSLQGLLSGCTPSQDTSVSAAPTPEPTTRSEETIDYHNNEYGFSFSLPLSWKGYAIGMDKWEGYTSDSLKGDVVVEQGPLISIVHPSSTPQHPRQDIPIMVFTIQQWDHLQRGDWHIGAAPIGPLELGRNGYYVFALPARYNYAFPEGWEEVEQILSDHPMRTFEPSIPP